MREIYAHYRIPVEKHKRKSRPKFCSELKPYSRGRTNDFTPHTKGGATVCLLVDDANQLLAEAWSYCSHSDTFSYKIGRTIARNRATIKAKERIADLQADAFKKALHENHV